MAATKLSSVLSGKTRTQQVTVECHELDDETEWWICHADGQITTVATAGAAMRAIQAKAKRRNPGCTVTLVTWRNVPDGFVPPKGG
jgi:nitroimidazol reductase NimA-like FMN-containing flavoprotein (pyridoxamine 5'-phosphate oxidase superfamily)